MWQPSTASTHALRRFFGLSGNKPLSIEIGFEDDALYLRLYQGAACITSGWRLISWWRKDDGISSSCGRGSGEPTEESEIPRTMTSRSSSVDRTP